VQPIATSHIRDLTFHYLPGFAAYIHEHRLVEYIREQILVSREVNLPLLRSFEHCSEEELIEFGKVNTGIFLDDLARNQAAEHIETSIRRWIANEIPKISRDEVTIEDVPLISYIRKRCFLKFFPEYFTEPADLIAAIAELDLLLLENERLSQNTYINLLKERLEEQSRFKDLIAKTSPGIVYIFNLAENRQVYTNDKIEQLLGYSFGEIQEMGESLFVTLVHPDDLARVSENHNKFPNEIRKLEYRVRHADGHYKWFRTYESTFKKDEQGSPVELIGIALDIDWEKNAEQQLVQREEQLLEAQQIAGIGSFDWNFTDAGKSHYSPQMLKMFNIQLPTNMENFFGMVHPDDREKLRAAIEKAMKGGGIYECEYRYLPGEKEKVFESRGIIIYNNGVPESMRGTVLDITEKHHIIRKLQESEELYKQAQAISHMGNWAWNPETNEVTWTDELYRIYGLEPGTEKITYDTFLSFVHPEDRTRVAGIIQDCIRNLGPAEFDHRIVLRDGSIKELHARGNALADDQGRFSKLIGTGQDVTREKEIRRTLDEKQSFIQKIADATPSLISSYNINTGKYIFVNKAVEKLLGYPVQQILDEGVAFFIDRVHPDDLQPIMEQNARGIEAANNNPGGDQEPILEFKYRLRAKDGKYRWFHTYGTIFDRNHEQKIEHVLNISVDITDIMEAEDILSMKNRELEQSNANLEEFAYIASHDLKEPLRKISSFGDRLLTTQADKLDASGRAYLDKIIDSSQRMQALINDLLTVSVISGNKAFEKCSLQDVLGDVLKTLEYKIEKKGAKIKSTPLPEAYIIPSQIRQLFQNLLSNSMKFARKNVPPVIKISHKILSAKQVKHYKLGTNNRFAEISVCDNGIGFDNQYAEQIFAIFNRLHGRSEYDGTGIGLAICRKIVTNHDGIIFANAKEGEGATFTFVIPIA
jgi:PAS domain S-box-containing protein